MNNLNDTDPNLQAFVDKTAAATPERIVRYRIERSWDCYFLLARKSCLCWNQNGAKCETIL